MATRRNKFIKLSGGFHNVPEIKVLVPVDFDVLYDRHKLIELLSDSVFRKISKHFCGMRDCRCGGIHRNLIAEECNG